MGREANRNYVRRIRLSEPQVQGLSAERTLFVEGVPPQWPSTVVAQYCLRAALENNCSYITVRKGVHSRQTYSVIKLLDVTRSLHCGGALQPPLMKQVPKDLATMGHKANRSTFGRTRPLVRVPSLNAVSGLSPAAYKEKHNGK